MKKQLLFLILALISFVAAGCAVSEVERGRVIPNMKYYVGGGFSMDYRAPSKGTVYLVEYNTRKLMVTESLNKDEAFEMSIDLTDEEVIAQFEAYGVKVQDADLRLYFIPLDETTP